MFRGKYSAADEAQKLIDKAFYWTITSSWHPLINMRSLSVSALSVCAHRICKAAHVSIEISDFVTKHFLVSLSPGSGPLRIEFRELKKI